ncbi:hypothetical protein Pma05_33250 [Plantactinospora mayteni]|uniref:Resolvase/invertase-type recombinase catalytic domain-containing protein n=2 Tax=Plantactinospora mayteni TaxID=566021 RepID=A0ABQ4EQ35_9ACTN|nr:hypothetical protein Pma05_33250 [Plantactinospora mayteni]
MLIVAQYLRRRALRMTDRGVAGRVALHAEVMDTLDRDGWIASVKIYRKRTGAGLLEAHEAVSRIARDGTEE